MILLLIFPSACPKFHNVRTQFQGSKSWCKTPIWKNVFDNYFLVPRWFCPNILNQKIGRHAPSLGYFGTDVAPTPGPRIQEPRLTRVQMNERAKCMVMSLSLVLCTFGDFCHLLWVRGYDQQKKLLDLKNPPSTKQKQFPPSIYTPPKFNLAPKKRYLEDYHLLLGPGNFQGPNSWNWVSPQPQLLQPRRRQRGRLGDFHPFHPDDLWCPRRAASRFSEQQVVPWS